MHRVKANDVHIQPSGPSSRDVEVVSTVQTDRRRAPEALSRVGSAVALSVISQLLGLLQLLLLLSEGAGRATDAYFYLLTWSTLPVQVLLVGTYYPLLLRGESLRPEKERLWATGASSIGVILVLMGSALYTRVAGEISDLPIITAAVCLMAATSVPAWLSALKDSSTGNPRWLSSVSLLPSIGALIALAATKDMTLGQRVVSMIVGQSLGYVSYWVLRRAVAKRTRPTSTVGAPQPTNTVSFGSAWLLSQAVVAYSASLWVQTFAASLPNAGLTILGVTAKVVGAGSTLVSNAVLPVMLNRSTSSKRGIIGFSWLILALAVVAIFCSTLLPHKRVDPVLVALAILWLASILFNGAMHRIAYRFHHPRFASITMVVSAVVAIGLVAFDATQQLSLASFLLALVALDLASGVIFAAFMKLLKLAACYSLLPLAVLAVVLTK